MAALPAGVAPAAVSSPPARVSPPKKTVAEKVVVAKRTKAPFESDDNYSGSSIVKIMLEMIEYQVGKQFELVGPNAASISKKKSRLNTLVAAIRRHTPDNLLKYLDYKHLPPTGRDNIEARNAFLVQTRETIRVAEQALVADLLPSYNELLRDEYNKKPLKKRFTPKTVEQVATMGQLCSMIEKVTTKRRRERDPSADMTNHFVVRKKKKT